ncbi:hypothetical protein KCU92_g168, partial [Aureobasidium melanogenum]
MHEPRVRFTAATSLLLALHTPTYSSFLHLFVKRKAMFRHVYVLRFTKQSKTLYTMYEKIIGRRDWKVIDHMYHDELAFPSHDGTTPSIFELSNSIRASDEDEGESRDCRTDE